MARATGDPRNKSISQRGGKVGGNKAGPSGHKTGGSVVPFMESDPLEVPDPPRKMLQLTRSVWELVWTSGIASALQPQDQVSLQRWIRYLDEWNRCEREMTKPRFDRLVAGSRGQLVLNPLIPYMQQLEGLMTKLEDKLGLSPMARARLGLTAAEGQLLANQLNAAVRDQDAVEAGTQAGEIIEISEYTEEG